MHIKRKLCEQKTFVDHKIKKMQLILLHYIFTTLEYLQKI